MLRNQQHQDRVLRKILIFRKQKDQSWGFELSGGWDQGQWIGE